jgi:3-hydroxyisobutyrate dehydrogenase-like beta-hydroxyacid dehydrogenase
MPNPTKVLPTLGVIGIGNMGAPMAARLLDARYNVNVFDTHVTQLNLLRKNGAHAMTSPSALANASEIILISLPTSDTFVSVVENELLPGLTRGKTVIDLGATELGQTRRIAEWLGSRGVTFLDAPVSGSAKRAREGNLSMFVGGQRDDYERCLPILKTIASLGKITYCGLAGSGQVVKGVEQLATGLGNAAYLEALAFGANQGIEPAALCEALEQSNASRASFESVVRHLLNEGGDSVSVNFTELPYYTKSEEPLPMARALIDFLKTAPALTIERGHLVPAYWNQLTHTRKEFVCGGALNPFIPEQPLTLPVALDADASSAKKGWIRAVIEGPPGKCWVKIAGQRHELVPVYSFGQGVPNSQVEINPADLAGVEALTFGKDEGSGTKCWLCSASVVLHY